MVDFNDIFKKEWSNSTFGTESKVNYTQEQINDLWNRINFTSTKVLSDPYFDDTGSFFVKPPDMFNIKDRYIIVNPIIFKQLVQKGWIDEFGNLLYRNLKG
jgi:hypothetical protein